MGAASNARRTTSTTWRDGGARRRTCMRVSRPRRVGLGQPPPAAFAGTAPEWIRDCACTVPGVGCTTASSERNAGSPQRPERVRGRRQSPSARAVTSRRAMTNAPDEPPRFASDARERRRILLRLSAFCIRTETGREKRGADAVSPIDMTKRKREGNKSQSCISNACVISRARRRFPHRRVGVADGQRNPSATGPVCVDGARTRGRHAHARACNAWVVSCAEGDRE